MGAFFRAQAEEATHTHWQIVHIAPTSTPGEPCYNQLSQSLPLPRVNGICVLHTFNGQCPAFCQLPVGCKGIADREQGKARRLSYCNALQLASYAKP